MEGWVDLGYPAIHRPGVELAIFWLQVRHSNHYTTEPPKVLLTGTYLGVPCACRLWRRRKNFVLIFNVKMSMLNFEYFWKCTPEMYPLFTPIFGFLSTRLVVGVTLWKHLRTSRVKVNCCCSWDLRLMRCLGGDVGTCSDQAVLHPRRHVQLCRGSTWGQQRTRRLRLWVRQTPGSHPLPGWSSTTRSTPEDQPWWKDVHGKDYEYSEQEYVLWNAVSVPLPHVALCYRRQWRHCVLPTVARPTKIVKFMISKTCTQPAIA